MIRTLHLAQRAKNIFFHLFPGKWLWMDRSVMDYTNWIDDVPGSGTYGEIRSADGTWSSRRGWYRKGYICKTLKSEIIH